MSSYLFILNIANTERRKKKETTPTASVGVNEGGFTLIIVTSSYVDLEKAY